MTAADSDRSYTDKATTSSYPSPISPPHPPLSKEVELRRAISAAARSAAYVFSSKDIIFEDEWLFVVNKPSGIYCETLLSSLLAHSKTTSNMQKNLHLANRLDRDTSGLMIITKSNTVAAKLVKAFTDHKVKKTYLAFCVGTAPDWDNIKLSGHGRSKFGAWRIYSASDVGRVLPGGSLVKLMFTSFEIISVNRRGKFRGPNKQNMDELEAVIVREKGTESVEIDEILVRAYPKSGRTHQIRLHCQHLGFSIRGDVKYGGVHEWKGMDCDSHDLHAESISFEHPVTGLEISLIAPSPPWVSACFRESEGCE